MLLITSSTPLVPFPYVFPCAAISRYAYGLTNLLENAFQPLIILKFSNKRKCEVVKCHLMLIRSSVSASMDHSH